MNLPEQAFIQLFPDKEIEYKFSITYNNRFKPYNANVRYTRKNINFNLSKRWRKVSKEIQIGLIQSLLLKIFKKKVNIIISGNFENPYDLRHPRSLISICYTLLEMPLIEAKRAFIKNPQLLLDRVKKRLDYNQIESGVRIIKGSEDNG